MLFLTNKNNSKLIWTYKNNTILTMTRTIS
jgi:hypothetical protein